MFRRMALLMGAVGAVTFGSMAIDPATARADDDWDDYWDDYEDAREEIMEERRRAYRRWENRYDDDWDDYYRDRGRRYYQPYGYYGNPYRYYDYGRYYYRPGVSVRAGNFQFGYWR